MRPREERNRVSVFINLPLVLILHKLQYVNETHRECERIKIIFWNLTNMVPTCNFRYNLFKKECINWICPRFSLFVLSVTYFIQEITFFFKSTLSFTQFSANFLFHQTFYTLPLASSISSRADFSCLDRKRVSSYIRSDLSKFVVKFPSLFISFSEFFFNDDNLTPIHGMKIRYNLTSIFRWISSPLIRVPTRENWRLEKIFNKKNKQIIISIMW